MHLPVFQRSLLLAARERAAGRRYAFVVRGRFDLVFRPGDFLSAAWLRTLPPAIPFDRRLLDVFQG